MPLPVSNRNQGHHAPYVTLHLYFSTTVELLDFTTQLLSIHFL